MHIKAVLLESNIREGATEEESPKKVMLFRIFEAEGVGEDYPYQPVTNVTISVDLDATTEQIKAEIEKAYSEYKQSLQSAAFDLA